MRVTSMNKETFERFLEQPNPDYEVSPPIGPGKFEGCEDHDLAERLYDMTLDTSYLDEHVGDVQGLIGWNARMGRFLVHENVQGFFSYTTYSSEQEASQEFNKIATVLEVTDE